MLQIIKKILQFFGLLEKDEILYAKEKGKEGEKNVASVFQDSNIKYLSNLYLPHYYGYTEIDLLLITRVGLFITEVKNYNNCIVVGNEEDEKWVVQYSSGKTYDMYNPLKQNENHIKTLLNYLDEKSKRYLYSLIVFSDRAILKVPVRKKGVYLINENELGGLVYKLNNSKGVLSDKEIDKIYNSLVKYTNVSNRVKKQHITNVEKYVRSKK